MDDIPSHTFRYDATTENYYSMYDFKLAVMSTYILLDTLSKLARKTNPAGRKCICAKEKYRHAWTTTARSH